MHQHSNNLVAFTQSVDEDHLLSLKTGEDPHPEHCIHRRSGQLGLCCPQVCGSVLQGRGGAALSKGGGTHAA